MAIHSLTVRNFRIHRELKIPFGSGITVLTGPNGSGKTSILEALSLLSSAKSFRSGANFDFIKRGAERASLEASVDSKGLENIVALEIAPERKKTLLNAKPIAKRRQVAEHLPFVVFSPNDHRIIDGDASERRGFLNEAIANTDFQYADTLRDFNRILQQRNKILKAVSEKWGQNVGRLGEDFDVWDQQFVEAAAELVSRRQNYLADFAAPLTERYQGIAKSSDHFEATYDFCGDFAVAGEGQNYAEVLRQALLHNRAKDLILGVTTKGPHRHEISLTINGNKAKFYGSQGEKRTAVLALRLAEVDLFRKQRGKAPVLLIDDVSSELDSERRQALVDLLKRGDSQVLITATELPVDLLNDVQHPFDHLDLTSLGTVTK